MTNSNEEYTSIKSYFLSAYAKLIGLGLFLYFFLVISNTYEFDIPLIQFNFFSYLLILQLPWVLYLQKWPNTLIFILFTFIGISLISITSCIIDGLPGLHLGITSVFESIDEVGQYHENKSIEAIRETAMTKAFQYSRSELMSYLSLILSPIATTFLAWLVLFQERQLTEETH